MGLLIFKERDLDDKTPFRKNEWHVGTSARSAASSRSLHASSDATAASGRSLIRRGRPGRVRRRIPDSARFLSHATFFDVEPTYTERARREESSVSTMDHQHPSPTARENIHQPNDSNETLSAGHNDSIRVENVAESTHNDPQLAGEYEDEDEREERQRRDQRRQSFGYVLARARARFASRTSSPERANRWRVASPDTERVILQQIENQSDSERYSGLYVDGASDSLGTAIHMNVSRSDGLGDRRRSLSGENDRPSDVEENWNSLMETIPTIDANFPSATSSFASDSASSILSRNRPRSSLTNTTTGSRTETVAGTSSRRLPCPESEEPIDSELPSFFRFIDPHHRPRSTSTRPTRIPAASLTHDSSRNQSAEQSQADQSTQSSTTSDTISHRLDSLDELMDMLSNGTEVPPEMWASVGISPHLGVRGLAARLRRRSERL